MRAKDLPEAVRRALGIEVRHKFGVGSNKLKRTEDGILFASQLECSVYRALCRNLKTGREGITLQPRFELEPKFTNEDGLKRRAEVYVADFLIGGTRVHDTDPVPEGAIVVDAKGCSPREFISKMKRFERKYGRLFVIKTVAELCRIPWGQYGIELKREFFL